MIKCVVIRTVNLDYGGMSVLNARMGITVSDGQRITAAGGLVV